MTSSGKLPAPELDALHHRDTGFAGDLLGGQLVAAGAHRGGRRSDPDEPGTLDRLGEAGALGEEPVAGMDRLRPRLERRPQMLAGVEVADDRHRLRGAARVQRQRVGRLGDRDRRDPELPAGAEDTHRDLAAVRDQQLADLAAHMRKTPNCVSGIGACSAAEIPSASTRRVSRGSRIPSSQSRALE